MGIADKIIYEASCFLCNRFGIHRWMPTSYDEYGEDGSNWKCVHCGIKTSDINVALGLRKPFTGGDDV